MSCISEVLKLKGDKEYLSINKSAVAEDGGIYKDYEYLITFNDMGFRCGYVAINKEHKFYGLSHYNNLPDLSVHGGVTFFDTSDFILEESLIENSCGDKLIGFDAGHAFDKKDHDLIEKYFYKNNIRNELINFFENISLGGIFDERREIRTKEYMIKECKELIDQLVELNNDN